MTFEEAMELVQTKHDLVTRSSCNIFFALRHLSEGVVLWELDNCDGIPPDSGRPYKPTQEDRDATDWMLYQKPQDNWVELEFDKARLRWRPRNG